MIKSVRACLFLMLSFIFCTANAQDHQHPIAEKVAQHQATLSKLKSPTMLTLAADQGMRRAALEDEVSDATFFTLQKSAIGQVLQQRPQLLTMELPQADGEVLHLDLYQANIFTPEFQVYAASDRSKPYPFEAGAYYWGIVNGDEESLAAIAVSSQEVSGFISFAGEVFNLGKLNEETNGTHVLFRESDLAFESPFDCGTDFEIHNKGKNKETTTNATRGPDNCVRMYIEVDKDIHDGKGGVSQAATYVANAFSQVAILYANDAINVAVNEILVWDVTDPYTGPSTSNYLTQFRNNLNGNYNGDLAHLVGYQGGGGIAYVDVVCNSLYGVGYSDINSSFANVPTYSWTIEVLTHEIGHNLGSPHTHDCSWGPNNNEAIDRCGPAAGYGSDCNPPAPLPEKGTIMSYCHLVGGVGIDFNLGFGPLPTALIQNRVYNASCLSSCGPACPDDDGDGICNEDDVCPGFDDNLLGTSCNDGDACTEGDTWTACNTCIGTFADQDGDGVCDADDVCPGGDDTVDTDGDGIPDFCECEPATESFSTNPLTHSGNGSSSTTFTFASGDKNVSFTVSGMNAKLNGNPNNRYIDEVTVTYVGGNGNSQTYGTFGGDQQSSVNVNISGEIQSVTVSLADGYDGNANGTLSVDLGTINYCLGTPPCPDADGDGVCDGDDACPGFDDNLLGTSCDDGDPCTEGETWTGCNVCSGGTFADDDNDTVCNAEDQCPGEDDLLDANGNGTPDCLEGECTTSTSAFNPTPLTHSGTGSSTSTVSFLSGNEDASFTISNLNQKLNGNPNKRYIEQVTVTYVDGGGTQTYGVYSGANQSSVNVSITGPVQSVTLELTNIHPDNPTSANMGIDMSAVTHCVPAGAMEQGEGSTSEFSLNSITGVVLYPNPARQEVFVEFDEVLEAGQVILTNSLGMQVGRYQIDGQRQLRIDLAERNIGQQFLFVTIHVPNQAPITKRLMVVD